MVLTEKVFVFPNPIRKNSIKALPEILDYLLGEGFTVGMEVAYREAFSSEYPIVSFTDIDTALKRCEFVLVIGGDGTMLHIASHAAFYGKSVLGINLGTMGFLTELDMADLELLKRIKTGAYHLDQRMLIDISVKNQKGIIKFSGTGLNDAAIIKKDISKTIKLRVRVNRRKVMAFTGDGVVICTPTGSTAYSLSAGGPILEPSSSCIAVTPVCPHAFGIKSFVVSSDKEIEISLPPQDNSAQLSIDGYQNVDVGSDDIVEIKQSDKTITLIRLKGIEFYERINQKLSNERF